jgi:hypothetical protein
MKPDRSFAKFGNEILGFGYAVEFLLPHRRASLALAVDRSVVIFHKSGGVRLKTFDHRFFYAFFRVFTLTDLVARWNFPQHLVGYPQAPLYLDDRPPWVDQEVKILRHQEAFSGSWGITPLLSVFESFTDDSGASEAGS